MKYLLPIYGLLNLSCTGIAEGEQQTSHTAQVPGTPRNSVGSGGSARPPATVPFGLKQGDPELLPFDVRVRRVATALKVQTDNPMFALMMQSNIKLGDYDHANGVLPDHLWIAGRISNWANALKPVCASTEMKTLFPSLPEHLPQLIKAAWGRAATQEELTEFQTAVAEAGLAHAVSYEATCLAVFTAAEFVYR